MATAKKVTTTTKKSSPTTNFTTKKGTELLIITRSDVGALSNITTPLAKAKINVVCFTGYEWNGEAAFRFVTDNNKKAREILSNVGYPVSENTVTLCYTDNTPEVLSNLTSTLANANINTNCAYSTANSDSKTTTLVLGTNNPERTLEVLKKI